MMIHRTVVGLTNMLGQVGIIDTGSNLVTGDWEVSRVHLVQGVHLMAPLKTTQRSHQWAPLLPPPLSTFLPLSDTLAKLAEHPPGGDSGIYKPSALLSDSPHPPLLATGRPHPGVEEQTKTSPLCQPVVVNHIEIINFGTYIK